MDLIARWRVPAAVVGLVAATVALVARLGAFRTALSQRGESPASVSFVALAPGSGSAPLLLAVGLLVGACSAAPVVPGRRLLATWGALVAVGTFAAGLVGVVVGVHTLALPTLLATAAVPLTGLVVPLLVGWGLIVVAVRGGSPARAATAAPDADALAPLPAGPPTREPAPDPDQQPVWAPDAASGAVWLTAGDAARGEPASGWGAGEARGWQRPEAVGPPALEPGPWHTEDRGDDEDDPTAAR